MTSDDLAARGAPELLPCPFCGGKYVVAQQNGLKADKTWAWWEVVCHDCDISVRPFDDRNQAIAAWDRRTPAALAASPEVQALIREAEARGMDRAADMASARSLSHTKGLSPGSGRADSREAWLRSDECNGIAFDIRAEAAALRGEKEPK